MPYRNLFHFFPPDFAMAFIVKIYELTSVESQPVSDFQLRLPHNPFHLFVRDVVGVEWLRQGFQFPAGQLAV